MESKLKTLYCDSNNIEVWHKRLGHLSCKGMLLLRNGLAKSIDFKENQLKPCIPIEGKQKCLVFPKGASKRSQQILELIHSDLCGPMSVNSWGGYRYLGIYTTTKWCIRKT